MSKCKIASTFPFSLWEMSGTQEMQENSLDYNAHRNLWLLDTYSIGSLQINMEDALSMSCRLIWKKVEK